MSTGSQSKFSAEAIVESFKDTMTWSNPSHRPVEDTSRKWMLISIIVIVILIGVCYYYFYRRSPVDESKTRKSKGKLEGVVDTDSGDTSRKSKSKVESESKE